MNLEPMSSQTFLLHLKEAHMRCPTSFSDDDSLPGLIDGSDDDSLPGLIDDSDSEDERRHVHSDMYVDAFHGDQESTLQSTPFKEFTLRAEPLLFVL